jgi:sulfur carrier protein
MSQQSEAIKKAVKVNGSQESLDAATIAELVVSRALDVGGVAVALNGRVVPRAAWSATPLAEGDTIEIVRAMQGG